MATDLSSLNPAAVETLPVVEPGQTVEGVNEKISGLVLRRRTPLWLIGAFFLAFLLVMVLLAAVTWLFVRGVGIWGVEVPVAWGFAITNFVWWIGIGHAGTLISAILLLLRQEWRTSINRLAEAMTVFAVAQAALFPILHLGRPWYFYWLLPYPSTMGVWPQFRSPLVWDTFAILTYGSVSVIFWYVGMIPDLATLRDRAHNRAAQVFYGILALGWRSSARHWQRLQQSYYLVAALVTALVVSVHTIVSFDFAVAINPGWHTTVYPPFFVAGAIYSGFAMVLVLIIPLRALFGLENFITMRHIDNAAKVMLASGLIVAYGYLMETFTAFYSGNINDIQAALGRIVGPFAVYFWLQISANVLIPQLLWIRRIRRNQFVLFLISLVILFGMWMERYVLITTNLSQDYLPSRWGVYSPTVWDFATLFGTIGLFFALMFLFFRLLPVIAIYEMRELVIRQGGENAEVRAPARPGPTGHPPAAEHRPLETEGGS
jgi:molybdopterin-containing oxidoreductase family membrane subunit